MSIDIVSKFLFPRTIPSYNVNSFPGELLWVPKSLNPQTSAAEDFVPCLLLNFPSARFLMIYLHSNAEDLGSCRPLLEIFQKHLQVHILGVEYPGYGICPRGPADETKVIENVMVAYRFVSEVLNWPPDRIIVLGRSVGTGPALELAWERNLMGVVLISPFLSVREVCHDMLGPLSYFVRDCFPNRDRVPHMRSPLLIVHGQRDSMVPCRHGQELYASCKARKLIVCPEHMGHDMNLSDDPVHVVAPMLEFFELPAYSDDELNVPRWAFDKRLSVHYKAAVPTEPLGSRGKCRPCGGCFGGSLPRTSDVVPSAQAVGGPSGVGKTDPEKPPPASSGWESL